MSTKGTISYTNCYHLYEEVMDDSVWLEINGREFNASRNSVTVELPIEVLEAIGKAYEKKSFPHQREQKPIENDSGPIGGPKTKKGQ